MLLGYKHFAIFSSVASIWLRINQVLVHCCSYSVQVTTSNCIVKQKCSWWKHINIPTTTCQSDNWCWLLNQSEALLAHSSPTARHTYTCRSTPFLVPRINNNNNNLRLLRLRQTAQPTMITTTACHAGQQWHDLYCHAGQQQQGLARA